MILTLEQLIQNHHTLQGGKKLFTTEQIKAAYAMGLTDIPDYDTPEGWEFEKKVVAWLVRKEIGK